MISDSTAALWSAVAASFAALSSFLIMLIQRRNLLESVRPELVLTQWSRGSDGQGDSAHEYVEFKKIRNVGRGAALHTMVTAHQDSNGRPVAYLAHMIRIPILAANEEFDANGRIVIGPKNIARGDKSWWHLAIRVTIFCWDSRGMRHETRYELFAVEQKPNVGISEEIAPGIMLSRRVTIVRPGWLLKCISKFDQIPGIRKLRRNKT